MCTARSLWCLHCACLQVCVWCRLDCYHFGLRGEAAIGVLPGTRDRHHSLCHLPPTLLVCHPLDPHSVLLPAMFLATCSVCEQPARCIARCRNVSHSSTPVLTPIAAVWCVATVLCACLLCLRSMHTPAGQGGANVNQIQQLPSLKASYVAVVLCCRGCVR